MGRWLLAAGLCWACSIVFAAFGLFMGYLLPSQNAMQILGPALARDGLPRRAVRAARLDGPPVRHDREVHADVRRRDDRARARSPVTWASVRWPTWWPGPSSSSPAPPGGSVATRPGSEPDLGSPRGHGRAGRALPTGSGCTPVGRAPCSSASGSSSSSSRWSRRCRTRPPRWRVSTLAATIGVRGPVPRHDHQRFPAVPSRRRGRPDGAGAASFAAWSRSWSSRCSALATVPALHADSLVFAIYISAAALAILPMRLAMAVVGVVRDHDRPDLPAPAGGPQQRLRHPARPGAGHRGDDARTARPRAQRPARPGAGPDDRPRGRRRTRADGAGPARHPRALADGDRDEGRAGQAARRPRARPGRRRGDRHRTAGPQCARRRARDDRRLQGGHAQPRAGARPLRPRSPPASSRTCPARSTTCRTAPSTLFGWVLREGVTNVVRHSGAANCWVRVADRSISVTDDGGGPPLGARPCGQGLTGLTARVSEAGGSLTVAGTTTQRLRGARGPARGLAPAGDPHVDGRTRTAPVLASEPSVDLATDSGPKPRIRTRLPHHGPAPAARGDDVIRRPPGRRPGPGPRRTGRAARSRARPRGGGPGQPGRRGGRGGARAPGRTSRCWTWRCRAGRHRGHRGPARRAPRRAGC